MLRLIATDLRTNAVVWLGVIAVLVTAGAIAGIPASLIDAALASDTTVMLGLLAIAGVVIALTAVSLVAVLTSIVRILVELRRPTFALWLIVGLTPRQVSTVLLAELAVVSTVSLAVGSAVAIAVAPPLLTALLSASPGLETVRIDLHAGPATAVAALALLPTVLSAIPLARAAGRTPVLTLLRGEQTTRMRVTLRVLGSAVLLAIAASMIAGLPGSLPTGAAQSVLIGPVLIAAAAVSVPVFSPPLIRAWTAIVPASRSASWHVARAVSTETSRRSSASTTAFLVAIGLPWTFLVGQQTAATAMTDAVALDVRPLALLLGGPTLLAAVGAAATVFMASAPRARDDETLRIVGAGTETRRLVVTWEATIGVVTAALIAVAAAAIVGVAESLLLGGVAPGTHPQFAPDTLAALVLLMLALGVTAALASRRPRAI